MSATLALRGFDTAYRVATRGVIEWRSKDPRTVQQKTGLEVDQIVADVARSVSVAKRWRLGGTTEDCLAVALTGVWALRRRDLKAKLVLGVKNHPFTAHAWVRVDDWVIDFPPEMHKRYVPIVMDDGQ
jgi:hypothetical protein